MGLAGARGVADSLMSTCSGSGFMRCSPSCFMGGFCLLDGPECALETRSFDAFGISSLGHFVYTLWLLIEHSGLLDLNAGKKAED